jgi:hypothetical protein
MLVYPGNQGSQVLFGQFSEIPIGQFFRDFRLALGATRTTDAPRTDLAFSMIRLFHYAIVYTLESKSQAENKKKMLIQSQPL